MQKYEMKPYQTYKIKIIQILEYLIGWLLVGLRIYIALAIIQPYRDMEAGDNQSLKS